MVNDGYDNKINDDQEMEQKSKYLCFDDAFCLKKQNIFNKTKQLSLHL